MANQRRRVRSIKYTKHVDPQGTHVSLELSEIEEWSLETASPDASSVEEAKKRSTSKKRWIYIGSTILLGLTVNTLYDGIIWVKEKLQQKAAALMATAPDYMACVWQDLQVVILSLL